MRVCLTVVLGAQNLAACSVRVPLAPVSFVYVLLFYLFAVCGALALAIPLADAWGNHGDRVLARRDECLGRRQPARPKFALPARPATAAAAAPCCSGPESRHLALVGRRMGFTDSWACHVCCINTSFDARMCVPMCSQDGRWLKKETPHCAI